MNINWDVTSTPSRRYPVRRNVMETLSLAALVAEKGEPPCIERLNLTAERGLILSRQQFENNHRMLSLQQKGGYVTLTQFTVILWHDPVAPILAGIITTAIIGRWRSRK